MPWRFSVILDAVKRSGRHIEMKYSHLVTEPFDHLIDRPRIFAWGGGSSRSCLSQAKYWV